MLEATLSPKPTLKSTLLPQDLQRIQEGQKQDGGLELWILIDQGLLQ